LEIKVSLGSSSLWILRKEMMLMHIRQRWRENKNISSSPSNNGWRNLRKVSSNSLIMTLLEMHFTSLR